MVNDYSTQEDWRQVSLVSNRRELEILVDGSTIWVDTIGKIRGSDFIEIFKLENSHVCGSSGYNPELGDYCLGCNERDSNYTILSSMRDVFFKNNKHYGL